MSSDLVSRLLETLDELERVARAAAASPAEGWRDIEVGANWTVFTRPNDAYVDGRQGHCLWDSSENSSMDVSVATHIARWDPQAVLRLVEAHRKLINLWRTEERIQQEGASPGSLFWAGGRHSALRDVIEQVAAGFGITEEG